MNYKPRKKYCINWVACWMLKLYKNSVELQYFLWWEMVGISSEACRKSTVERSDLPVYFYILSSASKICCYFIIWGIGHWISGMISSTVPVYIAESSTQRLRGRLVSSHVALITLGQLIASCVAGLFSSAPHNGWRLVDCATLHRIAFLFYLELLHDPLFGMHMNIYLLVGCHLNF
jgi:MFS family permease